MESRNSEKLHIVTPFTGDELLSFVNELLASGVVKRDIENAFTRRFNVALSLADNQLTIDEIDIVTVERRFEEIKEWFARFKKSGLSYSDYSDCCDRQGRALPPPPPQKLAASGKRDLRLLIVLGILATIATLAIGLIVWDNISATSRAVPAPQSASTVDTRGAVSDAPAPVSDSLIADGSTIEVPQPRIGRDPMAKWTAYSDGYTWVSATEEEKHALARRLAASSRFGNSEYYFYDALETFYSEPSLRKEKLEAVCNLVDAGGQALPANMRDY